jgi:dimethylglycine dehydrogenase
MTLFGARAVESMRMEMGYLHWKAEIITEFDPFEAGLDRFVKMDKDFIGKDALARRQAAGPTRKLALLSLDAKDAPAHGGASVMRDGRVVGTVTSGEWGHRTGLNLAYAYVEPDLAAVGTAVEIDVIGTMVPATVIEPPFDEGNPYA